MPVMQENLGLLESDVFFRSGAGYFDLTRYGLVEVSGPDASDFLQRMSTVDIRKLEIGAVSHGAWLTGRGQAVALGYLIRRTSQDFHVLLSPGQNQRCVDHLEQFHFGENLSVGDRSQDFRCFGVVGAPVSPMHWFDTYFQEDVRPWLGFHLVPTNEAPGFIAALSAPLLSPLLFDYLRIQAGVPEFGREISGSEIFLETGFDRAISRNKGCYPGQEVIERIFTYGSVNRLLKRVEWEGEVPRVPLPLFSGGKEAGTLVSWAEGPRGSKNVGLAYLAKAFWSGPLELSSGTLTATVLA